jgi:hypothetical protein
MEHEGDTKLCLRELVEARSGIGVMPSTLVGVWSPLIFTKLSQTRQFGAMSFAISLQCNANKLGFKKHP